MSNVLINENTMTAIANAIRAKNGTENTYKPAEMADAINAIGDGGITPTGTKVISISQNGTITEDVTNYASAQITVNVGGGGSEGATVISSVNFTGVRFVKIDIDPTWFETYDIVRIRLSATMSTSDWLYTVWNSTSGGSYGNKGSSDGCDAVLFKSEFGNICGASDINRSGQFAGIKSASYLYVYAYTSTTTMEGTYEILGFKE